MRAFPTGWRSSLTVSLSFVAGVAIERIIMRPVETAAGAAGVVMVFIGLLLIFN